MTKTTSLARIAAATLFTVALAGTASAQTQPQAQQPAKPAQAKPAQAQQPAKPAPGAPAQAQQGQPGPGQEPEVKFSASPWQKLCQEVPDTKKQACRISQILGVENQAVAMIDLVEIQDEPRRRLTVSVPLGMRLQPGLRLTLDKDPTAIPFVICQPLQGGAALCIGEIEVDSAFITKFRKANAVFLQMMNGTGRTISMPISNTDFGKVYDGPGKDAKVAMEEERKRIEEARAAQQAKDEQGKAALLKKGQEIEQRSKQGQ